MRSVGSGFCVGADLNFGPSTGCLQAGLFQIGRRLPGMVQKKRPELDLEAEALAALDEARAMPHGPERTAAMKKAGILRNAAHSHGIAYTKRGRPTKT